MASLKESGESETSHEKEVNRPLYLLEKEGGIGGTAPMDDLERRKRPFPIRRAIIS